MKFKICSVEISVSYLLICIFALCIVVDRYNAFIWCVLSIIIHESGHLFLMCCFGFVPEKIKITLFEISISDNSRHKRTNLQNFLIIFFGPLANFICFIVCYLLYLFSKINFIPFAFANLFVGLFNFLPVLSLDGGQLIYILLSRRASERLAERVVDIITFIFIFPLSALGFLVLFESKYNFSLLLVCVYLVFSLVCKNNRYY